MSEQQHVETGTLAAVDVLLDDGYDITIRRAKGGYRAECHDWSDPFEQRKVFGTGETWQQAILDAAKCWSQGVAA
jgi:hypothetical protein